MKSMAEIAEEITHRYGLGAMNDALDIAGKHAKDDGHGARILEFALQTAALVPEFRGEDPPAVYDCHHCRDLTVVPVFKVKPDGRRIEAVYSCQHCDPGLTDEAAFWRAQTRLEGWSKFNRFFDKAQVRRELVIGRMRELEGREKDR